MATAVEASSSPSLPYSHMVDAHLAQCKSMCTHPLFKQQLPGHGLRLLHLLQLLLGQQISRARQRRRREKVRGQTQTERHESMEEIRLLQKEPGSVSLKRRPNSAVLSQRVGERESESESERQREGGGGVGVERERERERERKIGSPFLEDSIGGWDPQK